MKSSPIPPRKLIPLSTYEPPRAPATEVVDRGVRRLRSIWRKRRREDDETAQNAQPELAMAPQELLNWIVPAPAWDDANDKLVDDSLQVWLDRNDDAIQRRILVAPPFSGAGKIVTRLAKKQSITRIAPPTHEEILVNESQWMDQWRQDEANHLLLPALDRCFLRHRCGLRLLQRWLDWLCHSETSVTAVVDSWAWAYLNRVLHLADYFAPAQVLSPYGSAELAAWFRALSSGPRTRQFSFRLADKGQSVLLPVADGDEDEQSKKAEPEDDYLRHVAARSRGNPGIAWAIWRHSLRIVSDEEVPSEAQEAAESDQGYTVWVRPWRELEWPEIPDHTSTAQTLVLHALLLHHSLDEHTLAQLLPVGIHEIEHILHRLRLALLVEQAEGRWRVSALGYPAVRNFIQDEGYLTDPL